MKLKFISIKYNENYIETVKATFVYLVTFDISIKFTNSKN